MEYVNLPPGSYYNRYGHGSGSGSSSSSSNRSYYTAPEYLESFEPRSSSRDYSRSRYYDARSRPVSLDGYRSRSSSRGSSSYGMTGDLFREPSLSRSSSRGSSSRNSSSYSMTGDLFKSSRSRSSSRGSLSSYGMTGDLFEEHSADPYSQRGRSSGRSHSTSSRSLSRDEPEHGRSRVRAGSVLGSHRSSSAGSSSSHHSGATSTPYPSDDWGLFPQRAARAGPDGTWHTPEHRPTRTVRRDSDVSMNVRSSVLILCLTLLTFNTGLSFGPLGL